jgi:peptide/nickel transport system ATP-binding protein
LDLQDQFDTSYLFISHNLSNARYLTKETDGLIGIMYLGEIVELGPPDEVLTNPEHPYTKALRWATPNLHPDSDESRELPVRNIDIPDPINPPSGCRFHTRCPVAREVCTGEKPALLQAETDGDHRAACFRALEDHEYWDSEPIVEDEGQLPDNADATDGAAAN